MEYGNVLIIEAIPYKTSKEKMRLIKKNCKTKRVEAHEGYVIIEYRRKRNG